MAGEVVDAGRGVDDSLAVGGVFVAFDHVARGVVGNWVCELPRSKPSTLYCTSCEAKKMRGSPPEPVGRSKLGSAVRSRRHYHLQLNRVRCIKGFNCNRQSFIVSGFDRVENPQRRSGQWVNRHDPQTNRKDRTSCCFKSIQGSCGDFLSCLIFSDAPPKSK